MSAEQEVRALLDERVAAVTAKDPAPLLARMADELDSFGVTPPHRVRGRDAMAAGLQAWFAGYASDIGYAVHELEVRADGDLAVATFVYAVSGTLHSGDEVDMWVRATAVLQRRAGRWLVVHQHESVPWDPMTDQGVMRPGSA